jgi:hypothetical protein
MLSPREEAPVKHKVLVAVLLGLTALAAGCSHSKEGISRNSKRTAGRQLVPGEGGANGTPSQGPHPEASGAKAERERRDATQPGRPDPDSGGRSGGGENPQ